MRLIHLCTLELAYRDEPLYDGRTVRVVPYGSQEATIYGEGDGVARGERLNGRVRWVNFARRRSDGVNLPALRGVVRTDDGADVLFTLEGRTQPASSGGKRRQVLTGLFEAADERYRWLNDAVCVVEGLIDSTTGAMRAGVYELVHELN